MPYCVKCDRGRLSNFMDGWISTSMKRRAARHAATVKPKTGPRCAHCRRLCAMDREFEFYDFFSFLEFNEFFFG